MNPPASRAPAPLYGTMPHSSPTTSRRAALLLGLGAFGALTVGCEPGSTEEPAPAPPPPDPTPEPPPPLAGAEAAATVEARLAGQAGALLKSDSITKALRKTLTAVAAGHRAHQLALAGPESTGRPTTGPTPRPTPSPQPTPTAATVAAGVKKLAGDETAAARKLVDNAHRTEAVTALFWASLAAAADGYAQALRQHASSKGAGPAKAPKPTPHGPVEPVDATTATRAMVEQLYAVGYGYQVALGHLDEERFERAAATLRGHRSLRDRLIGALVEASVEAPAAAPAYDVPVRPTDAASAAKLIMTLETALLPFCGQWVAAAVDEEQRELAVATLRSVSVTSVTWGGPLLPWPGYVEQ